MSNNYKNKIVLITAVLGFCVICGVVLLDPGIQASLSGFFNNVYADADITVNADDSAADSVLKFTTDGTDITKSNATGGMNLYNQAIIADSNVCGSASWSLQGNLAKGVKCIAALNNTDSYINTSLTVGDFTACVGSATTADFSGCASGVNFGSITVLTTGGLAGSTLLLSNTSSTASAFTTYDSVLAATRYNMTIGGKMEWRDTSGTGDVTLERTAANELSLGSGDTFKAALATFGDGTNQTAFDADGDIAFAGTARIDWTKITANGVTIRNSHGTTSSSVSDLQTAHDGNFYTLSEESGETPGMDIEVDFTGVTAFNWVQVLARYEQATSGHGITVMLEITPFDGSAWHRYDYLVDQQADLTNENHGFFVPDDAAYINSGVVKVRFVHEMVGTSPAHDLVIDECSLYR